MICRHRTEAGFPYPRSGNCSVGFTLLEIIIVLIIAALVIGGSITTIALNDSERILSKQSGEIELLAKKARTTAILHQIPYAIEFHPRSIKLLPFSQTLENQRTTSLGREIGGTTSAAEKATTTETLALDSEMAISISYWNTTQFITPNKSNIPIWRFDPDGLCEPITVRMTYENSYVQDTYHPLTASIAESESETR